MNESEVRKIVRGILSEYMTRGELGSVEDFADDLFNNVGIDVEFSSHFLDRLNDPRNGQEIEPEELESLFQKTYNKYGQKLPNWRKGTEAVITDFNSNINIPFVLNWNKMNKEFELVNKTIMRKKNFQTSNMKLKV
jgi:hypothetical protein